MSNTINLENRVAVVTGGAQGIGFAVSQRLLQSGAKVAIWDRDEATAAEAVKKLAQYGTCQAFNTDQTDFASVERATQATVKAYGRIDILVNNAGIAGANATLWEYPLDEWKRVLDIDLNGPFHCCRAVVPQMLKTGYGRIVNVASIAGKEGNPNASAYSAAKAGVIALTKSLGKELASHDIAVNCVTPAAARTAIFDQMSETHINFMLSKIPRGRFVKVEEIAGLIAWLASDENSFTTGGVFDISGGRATY
jgi:NAD(P)-dependent dehydrogenase (short-subunit alcohol dehydrogenase family)